MSINSDIRNPLLSNEASSSSSTTPTQQIKTTAGRRYICIEKDRLIETSDLKSACYADEIHSYVKEHGISGENELKILKDDGVEILQSIKINQFPPEVMRSQVKIIEVLALKKLLLCGDRLFNAKFENIIVEELLSREDHGLRAEIFLEYLEKCKSIVKILYSPKGMTPEQLSHLLRLVGQSPNIRELHLNCLGDTVLIEDLKNLENNLCLEYLEINRGKSSLWEELKVPKEWTKNLPQSLLILKIPQSDLSLEDIKDLPRGLQTLVFRSSLDSSFDEIDDTPLWINYLPQKLKSFSFAIADEGEMNPTRVNLSKLSGTLEDLTFVDNVGLVSMETIPRCLRSLNIPTKTINSNNVNQLPPNLVSLTVNIISQDSIKDLPQTLMHLTFNSFDSRNRMHFEDFPRGLITIDTNDSLPKGDIEKLPKTLTACTLSTINISKEDLHKLPPSLIKLNFFVDITHGDYLYELPSQLKELIITRDLMCMFDNDIDWKQVPFENLTKLTLLGSTHNFKFDEFNAVVSLGLKNLVLHSGYIKDLRAFFSKISQKIDHVELLTYPFDGDPFVRENGRIRTDLQSLPEKKDPIDYGNLANGGNLRD